MKKKKKKLFIIPNSLTIQHTSTLHNTFYFNNTSTKIQLRSDPANMQPDKLNATLKDPLQRYGLLTPRCWVHLEEAPSEQWDIIITHGEELQDSEGGLQGIGMSH